jgi:sialate O-acetylesterase
MDWVFAACCQLPYLFNSSRYCTFVFKLTPCCFMLRSRVLISLFSMALPFTASAAVQPAALFVDHMVIQRDTEAPVWGTADAGEAVTVTGSWGESAKAVADSDGKWRVNLPTPAAGGPYTLTFAGTNTVELSDVLSGDVWLCSGQSNMAWYVMKSLKPAKDIASANYPQIRSFMVERNPSAEPVAECGGEWQVCTPETVKRFSATAYFTGRKLHQELQVPIGLLTSCWGGTRVEAWTPAEAQAQDPAVQSLSASLAKKQKKKKKKDGPAGVTQANPGALYNGMIHPLSPFAVKGVMWYQGEANAKTVKTSEHYRVQLPRMVRSWRAVWGQDFPFYAVQLPNFRSPQQEPVELQDTWAMIRESFVLAAEATEDMYLTTTIDLGEAKNIHPKNKQDVGLRLASTILNHSYGLGTPTTPLLESHSIEGNAVVLRFAYTGSGLVAQGGGALKTFAIAGADRNFVAADAAIVSRDGVDCVVVRSAAVPQPVAVRYAWAKNPVDCNLYSKEGFPASPFRTDTWEVPAKPE